MRPTQGTRAGPGIPRGLYLALRFAMAWEKAKSAQPKQAKPTAYSVSECIIARGQVQEGKRVMIRHLHLRKPSLYEASGYFGR